METVVKTTVPHLPLEDHFAPYRADTIGQDAFFEGPFGQKPILYADWIASGRLYRPIEARLMEEIGPYVANTHTETSYTGRMMTEAYAQAREQIKAQVNAGPADVFIATGTGMTGAVLKFQRILGLKLAEQFSKRVKIKSKERPVVFVSHMEHHSNQTSWMETMAEVVVIQANAEGRMDLDHLDQLLKHYAKRPIKIASITSASNVTGVGTPYYEVARRLHRVGGLCFVDFACSGPYVDIDMHPADEEAQLDAIFFSPHKFLGGPGSPGVLIFNNKLYKNKIPDHPGGGTVSWTNPWGDNRYISDIEVREDGGTPGFLQTIKAALAMQLKMQMGVEAIAQREQAMVHYLMERMKKKEGIHILAGHISDRLGAISFLVEGCHYNLTVALLNDLFGIQTRGGCSCAGTYGHYLLHLDRQRSLELMKATEQGDVSLRPGWVRVSLHPTMSSQELAYLADALDYVADHWQTHQSEYHFDPKSNSYLHRAWARAASPVKHWFQL